jgi:hypothetical protein
MEQAEPQEYLRIFKNGHGQAIKSGTHLPGS